MLLTLQDCRKSRTTVMRDVNTGSRTQLDSISGLVISACSITKVHFRSDCFHNKSHLHSHQPQLLCTQKTRVLNTFKSDLKMQKQILDKVLRCKILLIESQKSTKICSDHGFGKTHKDLGPGKLGRKTYQSTLMIIM